jgi:general secretion pathway protein E
MAKVTVRAQAFSPVLRRRDAVLDYLRDRGVLDASALARAEVVAARTKQPVELVLNQLGNLPDDELVAAYAQVAGCDVWRPAEQPPARDMSDIGVELEYLKRAQVVPLTWDPRELVCAAYDPLDDEALAGLAFASGRLVRILAARPSDFRRAFDALFGASVDSAVIEPDRERVERELDLVNDASLESGGARLVADVMEAAIAQAASDVHFEPRRHDFRIRLRVDGRLIEHQVVSADLAAATVSRVKVIANLNLGERRLPQDGRTSFVAHGKQVDVRVATSPTVFGEAAVLRILDRAAVPLDLAAMGLSENVQSLLGRAVKSPYGIFLVTGPTGSGKTTTLYALLQGFAGTERKVLSVEDPVEYHFEHVTQTQVAPQLGLTFATALRSFLRQDPDVILVGEIRDPETAAVAIQAAMTGHFVLASVHANTALAVIPRLQDMGVEPYQLAAAFRGVVAQRLVRRLCTKCRVERKATRAAELLRVDAGLPPETRRFDASGCSHCNGSGFRGRIPIAEGFLGTDEILRAIAERHSPDRLAELAREAGLDSMLADGLMKASAGLTTDEEVLAAVDG